MNTNTPEKHIVKTFLSYTIPCIVGMLLTSFIIVVDGLFIGYQIGENGLAAINLTLPVMYILLAITILLGVGGVTLVAQSLGTGKNKDASYYFSVSLEAIACCNLLIIGVVKLFFPEILVLLGAIGDICGYVKDFLGILSYFYIFMMMNMAFSMFIRAEGKPKLSLFFGLAGNILNVILDYLFIIKFDWGMQGAALASGISVLLPFLLGMWYFLSGKSIFKISACSVNFVVLKNMIFLGMAEFIVQISVSVTTYIFNQVLLARLGLDGVAAFTIIGYVMFVENMIVTGIAVGIHPLISFYFGAKNSNAIWKLFKMAIAASFVTGLVIFGVAFALSDYIVGMFAHENQELRYIASVGLRFFSVAFILNGYNMMAAALFTSIGDAKKAVVISSLRSLILSVSFILLLPKIFGDIGIWLTPVMSELVTFALAYVMVIKCRTKMIKSLRRSIKGNVVVDTNGKAWNT